MLTDGHVMLQNRLQTGDIFFHLWLVSVCPCVTVTVSLTHQIKYYIEIIGLGWLLNHEIN